MRFFAAIVVSALATRSYGAAPVCTGRSKPACLLEVHCQWDGTSACSPIEGGVPTETDFHASWDNCASLASTCNEAASNPECQNCTTTAGETCIPSNYILTQIDDAKTPLPCSTHVTGECSGLYTQVECLASTTLPCKWIAQYGGGSCYHVKENPGTLTPVYQPGHTTACQPTTLEACPYTDGCALCTGLASPLDSFNGCTSALYGTGINTAQTAKCAISASTTSTSTSTSTTSSAPSTDSSTDSPSTSTSGPDGSQGSVSVLTTTASFGTPAFIAPFSIAIVSVLVSTLI